MLVILVLIVIFGALAYLWAQKKFRYWSDRGITSAPTTFPYGNLKGLGREIPTFLGLDKIYKSFKGATRVLGIYFFVSPTLMILDVDLLKDIYIREFTSFHDRSFYYNKEDDPLSANLLTLEGPEWRERRLKLSPIFTSGKLKMMFEIVDSIGDKLVEALDKELKINDKPEMRSFVARYAADVISSVAFGLDSNCLADPNSEFYKYGKQIVDLTPLGMIKLFFTAVYPNLSRRLHLRANPKEPVDFLHKVFIETIKQREKGGVQRNDYVQLLLKLKESASLTIDEMSAEAFIFFSGGFETSSTALTFCLYELSLNPEIQTRLRKEIQDGLEGNEGKLSYDLLFHYQYLDMVLNEVLRKYPVIPVMMRKCTKTYAIPGTDLVINKGQGVMIPIYSIQHDAEHYPLPERFDPERFSPENSANRNPLTFLAFGEGPRNCIGIRFGMLQMKIALVKLLTNFEFSVCEKTTIPMDFVKSAPFLSPIAGMCLKVEHLK